MTLLEGILSVTVALLFIYLMIGAFLWTSNHEVVKVALELDSEPKPPLWLVSIAAVALWPWMHYKEFREEWEKRQDEQKPQFLYDPAHVTRRGYETPEKSSGITRLHLRESVDQSHKERVASYYDPYEHASWDESFPVALPELVGDDDSDRIPEYPSTERSIPVEWRTPDPFPSPMETSPTTPSKEESWGSSQSDYGMGSDCSGSSGSDSCSSSSDSSSSSCGGE